MLFSANNISPLSEISEKELRSTASAPSAEQARCIEGFSQFVQIPRDGIRVIFIEPADNENPIGKFVTLKTDDLIGCDARLEGKWGIVLATSDSGIDDNIMRYVACCRLCGLLPPDVIKIAIITESVTLSFENRDHLLMCLYPNIMKYGIFLVNAFFGTPGKEPYDPLHSTGAAFGDHHLTRRGDDIRVLKPDPELASRFSVRQKQAAMLLSSIREHVFPNPQSTAEKQNLTLDDLTVLDKALRFCSQGLLSLPRSVWNTIGKVPYPLSFCTLEPSSPEEEILEDLLNKLSTLNMALNEFYAPTGFSPSRSRSEGLPHFVNLRIGEKPFGHEIVKKFCEQPFSEESTRQFFIETRANLFHISDIISLSELEEYEQTPIPSRLSDMLRNITSSKAVGNRHISAMEITSQTSALAELYDSLSALLITEKQIPSHRIPASFRIVSVSNGYDATPLALHGRGEIHQIQALYPDGNWGIMLLPNTNLREPDSLALCAVALGMFPSSIKKLFVGQCDWNSLAAEEIKNVRELFAATQDKGVPIALDATGLFGGDDGGLMDKVIKQTDQSQRNSFYTLRTASLAIPEILAPLKEFADCIIAKRLSDGIARVVGEARCFTDSMLDFLSFGKTKYSGCVEMVVSHPGFDDSKLSQNSTPPMFTVVLPPFSSSGALPEWAKPALEFIELVWIWQAASQSVGFNLKRGFPEGVSRETCYDMAEAMGIPSMIEAYYAGVPLDDLLGKTSHQPFAI